MALQAPQEALSTRDRIRQAALDLFGDRGYDGASMNELAERVGVAKPSLYNYYRSKEELLLDLVAQGMSLWVDACMAPFRAGGTFERQLAEHLRVTTEFARQRPHVVAVFHLATTHVHGDLAARVQALVEQIESDIRATVRRRLDEAIAAGELAPGSAEDIHAFLGVFFHGLLFLQTNCPHLVGPTEERLDKIWQFLFRGISGREPKETVAP